MELKPLGDYYTWYCDWCDSRNLTLWTKIEQNCLVCTACQKRFPLTSEVHIARTPKSMLHFNLL
jgi:hypothetical protein